MKKNIQKGIICGLTVVLLAGATACGGGGGGGNDGPQRKENALFVDLHTLMPSASLTATASNPYPVTASHYIAKAYESETNGCEIQWATDYAKPTDSISSVNQWYTSQISRNNCPAIGFTFGSKLQYKDYYVTLNDYLEQPNPYVPGNEHWKDLFQDWVWEDPDVVDAKGNIVSIPIMLDAGSATAMYYNKSAFTKASLDASAISTWGEFTLAKETLTTSMTSGSLPFVPYTGDTRTALDTWAVEFSIAPGFAKNMMQYTDYDQSGKTTTGELVRAVLEGHFDMNNDEVFDMYYYAKEYYKTDIPVGWESDTTFTKKWSSGNVGMMAQGLWYLRNEDSNNDRKFDYDVFPTPVLQSDTTGSAADLTTKTLAEGHQSNVLMSFNVMKKGVENNAARLAQAIDFLMYLTAPEAVETICDDYPCGIPAVKDADLPALLSEHGWTSHKFVDIGGSEWPNGFTIECTAAINAAFTKWVNNLMDDEAFKTAVNNAQRQGAQDMVDQMNLNTTGWNIV